MQDRFEHAMDAVGRVAKTALIPWGGAEACVNGYEAVIRAATDHQLRVARTIDNGPARSFVASCANATRDIGATHLSRARWMLNL